MTSMRRQYAYVLLCLLLLIAQQAGTAHLASHATQQIGQHQDHEASAPNARELCLQCAVFTAMHSLPSVAFILESIAGRDAIAESVTHGSEIRAARAAYRSRAPPLVIYS